MDREGGEDLGGVEGECDQNMSYEFFFPFKKMREDALFSVEGRGVLRSWQEMRC